MDIPEVTNLVNDRTYIPDFKRYEVYEGDFVEKLLRLSCFQI